MSKFMKRLLSALIAVVMLTAMMMPQAVSASSTESKTSVFYYQRDAKWGYGRAGYSACYLSSFAR